MNRKEASFILANIDRRVCDDELNEALDVAIKALDQEPKILNTLDFAIDASNGDTNYFVGFRNGLRYSKSLIDGKEPQFESCTEQEPKTGHWIFDDECKEHGHCSRCGYGSVDLVDGEPHNFCRKCGAWMVEPQERSSKE